ncbi:MAG: SDR family oxidoreductase [Bdellovibrio sp.]|nr:SDR family oxidoreductase [Bdellovibrio sp.]
MRVLVLGVTGMLGSTVFKLLSESSAHEVYGTARSNTYQNYFSKDQVSKIIADVDVLNFSELNRTIEKLKPEVIINCIGLVKQLAEVKDPLVCLPLNSMLPHQLIQVATKINARVIHISTDCVFSGKNGHYLETDFPDAEDLYGRSKYIGELQDFKNAITLRTSIIGHELHSNRSLVDWFLSQKNNVKGFRKAIFSGLPTIEMAHIICDFVMTKPDVYGLYHVSAAPINKYDLLKLVAEVYQKQIEITPDDTVQIDRSLDSKRFTAATGYQAPAWPELIQRMYKNKI